MRKYMFGFAIALGFTASSAALAQSHSPQVRNEAASQSATDRNQELTKPPDVQGHVHNAASQDEDQRSDLPASIDVAQAQNAPGTSPQTTQPQERGAMMPGMMGGEIRGHEMGEHWREGPIMRARINAAIFRIRRADTSIFIKCADNEFTQACVTAAGTLLDKFSQQPTTSPKP